MIPAIAESLVSAEMTEAGAQQKATLFDRLAGATAVRGRRRTDALVCSGTNRGAWQTHRIRRSSQPPPVAWEILPRLDSVIRTNDCRTPSRLQTSSR